MRDLGFVVCASVFSSLLVALTVFAGAPFLYTFVETPEQLLALRLGHGLATAIFGPVTLAYVLEMSPVGQTSRLAYALLSTISQVVCISRVTGETFVR